MTARSYLAVPAVPADLWALDHRGGAMRAYPRLISVSFLYLDSCAPYLCHIGLSHIHMYSSSIEQAASDLGTSA